MTSAQAAPPTRQSFEEFTAETKGNEQDDSLVKELMSEIKRLKEEKEVREEHVKEQMQRQQEQFKQLMRQQQGEAPHISMTPPAPGVIPTSQPTYGAVDHSIQAMLMQMQRVSEQMNRENQALMQQIQGEGNMASMGGGIQGEGRVNYNQMGDLRGIKIPPMPMLTL